MAGKRPEALTNPAMDATLKRLGLTIRDLIEAEERMNKHGSGRFNVNRMSSIKDIKKKNEKKTKKKTRNA
mgnify:CR=1 FL=1|tara:strand:- start:18 stop:227 length:210 start_codon:yes stop_codon:yes gene_type:complete